MKVTKITVRRVEAEKGLFGFCNIVVDDSLYLGNIAIFSRLNKPGYRLVFPEKKVGEKKISIFHPLTTELYFILEQAINNEIQNESK